LEDYVVTAQFHSHLSPKLEARPFPEKGGMGVFARKPIDKGELLVLWGGRIIDETELDPTMPNFSKRVLQIEEGLYLLAPELLEPSDRFNHSCDPNAGFNGQIGLVAMQDIEIGEEVCFDYAMCDGTPYDEFICSCGAWNCRGEVTGEDWKRPELRERYSGYYSPYLQRRIEMLEALEAGTLSLEVPLGV
jgi:SET domain-containing protein